MYGSRQYGNYTLACHFGTIIGEERAGVLDFWTRNNALPPGESAEQRVNQVVLTAWAKTATRRVIGANSVYRERWGADGPEYYMYRTFIQPDHRRYGLSGVMLELAFEVLNRQYRAGEPVGLAFLTDNPKLQRPGAMILGKRKGWEHLGRGPLGRDLWRKLFSPAEVPVT